jgi:cardiolipin synthase
MDEAFGQAITQTISTARDAAIPVRLSELKARPFVVRFVERVLWLASPYL